MVLCSRCKKRPAVVFITRMEGDKTTNDGLCILCAKELGIKPVDDMLQKFGISDEDLEQMQDQMAEMFGGGENGENGDGDGEENGAFSPGGAPVFPFLQNLFGNKEGNMPPALSGAGNNGAPGADRAEQTADARGKDRGDEPKEKGKNKKRKYLEQYCVDLTGKARAGEMDPVVGRAREIERVVQILSRRQKNNPCLIGEPGVGKTAIAEGLAQRIADGQVTPRLQDKEIFLLDLTALVAGTQFRGQFEARIKGLIDEIKADKRIILFIDEVHNLVGAGDAEGSMSAANILKPALSRGEIQVIGATTFNEYRKHIEKDAALERRFQPVTVEEPSEEQTLEILKGVRPYYERFHGVCVSDDVLRRAVSLSERYITDRFLPDKAIDLLDEACAAAALRNKFADEYAALCRKLTGLKEDEQEKLAQEPVDYEQLAVTRASILNTERECTDIRPAATQAPVADNDLARVVELWTGIPAAKIEENEMTKLARLEERMKERIIGQDEAVALVCAAIRRHRVHISARRRPASFIFVGPTGVGKT
ncbi:MAG: ATP-dependent Clp protease ATP-binding subunit, partial [Oscillospiraceae bacterium]|nr:ATP-dependent Clp protease ATP-binding subunit [Oscillospiraceae bacterium]